MPEGQTAVSGAPEDPGGGPHKRGQPTVGNGVEPVPRRRGQPCPRGALEARVSRGKDTNLHRSLTRIQKLDCGLKSKTVRLLEKSHRRAVGPRVRHTVSRPDTKAGWQEGTPKNPTEPKKYLLFGQCWEEAKTVGSRPGRTFADRAGAEESYSGYTTLPQKSTVKKPNSPQIREWAKENSTCFPHEDLLLCRFNISALTETQIKALLGLCFTPVGTAKIKVTAPGTHGNTEKWPRFGDRKVGHSGKRFDNFFF